MVLRSGLDGTEIGVEWYQEGAHRESADEYWTDPGAAQDLCLWVSQLSAFIPMPVLTWVYAPTRMRIPTSVLNSEYGATRIMQQLCLIVKAGDPVIVIVPTSLRPPYALPTICPLLSRTSRRNVMAYGAPAMAVCGAA
eukprot:3749172-Rhodomonas_salina.2